MEAYPLHWPIGYKRTDKRESSRFKTTMEIAQQFLHAEVRRLKATNLIVSTNVPVRKDGMLYADWMSRRIDDPGVAIYFKYDGLDISMCCDKYERVWENVYALAKGIEAIRGMERWGISDFMKRSFTGFAELPYRKTADNCYTILEVEPDATPEQIKTAYRKKALELHPDKYGGDKEKFIELQSAYESACAKFMKNFKENNG